MRALDSYQYAEEELAQAALSALQTTTGLNGRLVPLPMNVGRGDYRPDVAVELNVKNKSLLFYGECKTIVDRRSVLAQVKTRFDGLNAPGLLIASYLSEKTVESCRAIGLQSIDTAGNAYLDAPGLYILVKGQKRSTAQVASARARMGGSASALRMVFALLVHPELMRASYREIATTAGIALGTVGWVFRDLVQRGLVTGPDKALGRRLLEPNRLLDEWVATYPMRLRPKLHARRFKAPNPNWWEDVDPIELDAWWSGEVAADHLTGMLKPSTQTLYVAPEKAQRCVQMLITKYRLRPDADGECELLDTFWNMPRAQSQPQLAPSVLVYADLMASLDSRNLDVAKTIRDTVIADVQHPA
ncbi:MAG: type IV toxin-antitoxin system AbiEi family antitoxin [Chloroflexota bacterium]|nr:type IV toxin-antitoxin system AbiEi family antitoxin [Chloroflexota bacterium]